MARKPFFQCQRCGNCCKWPGEVLVNDDEIDTIADYLEMPAAAFVERYTKVRANRQGLTLKERPNHECIFLDGIECTINDVKPAQCRGFPNTWNFPGWRKVCEAVAVEVETEKL